jgi:hypothetical protein
MEGAERGWALVGRGAEMGGKVLKGACAGSCVVQVFTGRACQNH